MEDLSRVTTLSYRIPRNRRHQDHTSSERLSEGRPPFVSDTRDEKGVDIGAWGSRDIALGGVARKVCMLSGSLVSVTEPFVVVCQRGCCREGAATLQHRSSPWNAISIHLFSCFFFFIMRHERVFGTLDGLALH